MLDLLNMCGISVTGDLSDGVWRMGKFSCPLIPSFGCLIRQVGEYELEFVHGNNKETVDVGWTMTVRNMQEISYAIGQLLKHYMQTAVIEQYNDNLKKKVLA